MKVEDRLGITISDGAIAKAAGTSKPTDLLPALTVAELAQVAGEAPRDPAAQQKRNPKPASNQAPASVCRRGFQTDRCRSLTSAVALALPFSSTFHWYPLTNRRNSASPYCGLRSNMLLK
jgi:hypothetical protein